MLPLNAPPPRPLPMPLPPDSFVPEKKTPSTIGTSFFFGSDLGKLAKPSYQTVLEQSSATIVFLGGVQTKMSWRSPLFSQYSR